jgi:hypothetical protein
MVASAALLAALAPASAAASGLDLYGAGSRSGAMGTASAGVSSGHLALFSNPAGMLRTGSTVGLSFGSSFDGARIALADRPAGYDLPDLGPSSPAIPTDARLRPRSDTRGLNDMWSVTVGGASDLGVDWLRVGALAFLPVDSAGTQRSVFHDEREQYFSNRLHFDLLDTRNQHQVILTGAAVRVTDWLSVGAALSFMPRVEGTNRIYMESAADQENIELTMDISQSARWRPILGITVTPTAGVSLAATFRDAQLMRMETVNEIQIRGLHTSDPFPLEQVLDVTTNYSPRQVVFGIAWDAPVALLAFDWAYTVWSAYPGDDGHTAGFDDTFSARLGVEAPIMPGHVVRTGFAWEPSPVPRQPGRTNYVDNDRILLSVGSGHTLPVGESRLELGWHLQLHALVTRTERKDVLDTYPACADGVRTLCDEIADDRVNPATGQPWPEAQGLQTGNPGFPGWTSGGWIGSAGVEAIWNF